MTIAARVSLRFDALVLFGVTGDLAHKKVLPALYAMVRRGVLDVPVVGQALGGARRPAHYLAIPPALFATVIEGLGAAGLTDRARVIVEKPFGRDLASAR